ncbi:MAG: molybdate ABC transporter substrate-binding protein [Alphaproteobacteria bacterium]|nr:molybdate ABC transporter substrate-binding protein [Alphaproteobacteria bacterium]
MYPTRYIAAALAAFWLALAQPAAARSGDVLVFAAASLKEALDAVAAQWNGETGKKAVISYAASSALARQIEQGAPAQMFISADLDWMDYVAGKNLIRKDTRSNLLGNRIVLIAPKDSKATVKIERGFPLASMLGGGRLAMADVRAVPAGKYGKSALEFLGVWESVTSRVVQVENVRVALVLVGRREAPLGIVYQTDAAVDPNVKVIGTFPEESHPQILYPVALTSTATHPDAAAFLAHVKSAAARPVFAASGFTVLD